jgi:hypothetical protein
MMDKAVAHRPAKARREWAGLMMIDLGQTPVVEQSGICHPPRLPVDGFLVPGMMNVIVLEVLHDQECSSDCITGRNKLAELVSPV